MKETGGMKILKSFIKAVITLAALTMDYGFIADDISLAGYANQEALLGKLSKLFYSIEMPTITAFLLIGFLTLLYQCAYDRGKFSKRVEAGVCTMAFIAAFFAIVGKSFYVYDDIWVLLDGMAQCLKGMLVFVGLFLLFSSLIRLTVFGYIKYCDRSTKQDEVRLFHNKKYAGILIAGVLLAAWLPTIVAYYPAVFMGDSEDIIYMAYNYPSGIETTVLPLKEGFYVTNHHPAAYTGYVSLILHIVTAIGGSYNLGIFFCAAIQCAITLWILTYSCMYCANELKNERLAIVAALFYALFPLIPKYAIMISKDTFFADLLLLWAILIHKAVNTKNTAKNMAALTAASIGILLIRKNGIYVIILTLILATVLYKRYWKQWLFVLAAMIVMNALYSNIVLPVVGIPDGSIREMLSIPFQQTARYVKYHADEVTEEEKYAISCVLDYGSLAQKYSGNLSDPVKATYNKNVTDEELEAYFIAWFRMFLKHPETYMAAFFNNYYGYFYPVVNDAMKLARTSVGSMENVNRDGYFDFSHCYDRFHTGLRDALTFYDVLWMHVPLLNLLMTSALYVWMVMMAFFLKWIRKDKAAMLVAMMYLALILTVLVGPSNAIDYERYVFPCILGMPFLITLALSENEWGMKNV